jgi:hypothetical protein
MKKQTNQASTKLKLENYPAKKKLKPGRYITVFDSKGAVKLLNTNELLPAGVPAAAAFSGNGRELIETFNPQYGGGPSPIAGRFVFRSSNNYDTDWFGWRLTGESNLDEELSVNIYMGEWGGPVEPAPAINFAVLEIHLYCNVAATLAFTVNGAGVSYEFGPDGESKLVFYIRKPADSNYSRVSIKLKRADNATSNRIWVNRIERYSTLFLPSGDLETLEE